MNKIYNDHSKFQEKVMSPNKIEKRRKAVKVADAINNIEGVPISEKAKKLSTLWVNGELSSSEMKKILIDAHRKG